MTAVIGAAGAQRSQNALLRLRGATAISVIWCATLVLPAYSQVFDPANGQIAGPGYQILFYGWIAILYGQTAWLANLTLCFLLVSLLFRRFSDRASRVAAVATVVFMTTMVDLVIHPAFHGYPHLLIGGWLWLANNLAAAAFAFVVTRKSVSIKQ